jgi:hypothetical protein
MDGKDLKKKLEDLGYTKVFIAKKMGTIPQNVNGWFLAGDVKTGTIEKLAEVLELPISVFYGEAYNKVANSGNNNATAINNSVATATANDDRLLTLLLNKDEQLLKSMEQTTLAMKQTSKAQEQMDEIIAELRKR